jgi:protein required for attachment to host cells
MSQKYEHRTAWNTWIIVADRARARIYDTVWPELPRLEEVGDMVHPEATLHVRDTVSDGPGTFRQVQTAPHSGDPRTDFPHRMADEFAHQIRDYLEAARLKGRFGHLVVVAPPLMLAALRKEIHHPLRELIVDEIDSDYIELTPAEVRRRLSQHVQAATT